MMGATGGVTLGMYKVNERSSDHAWADSTGAPQVTLRCYDETYGHQFDDMVATLRNGHWVSRPSYSRRFLASHASIVCNCKVE